MAWNLESAAYGLTFLQVCGVLRTDIWASYDTDGENGCGNAAVFIFYQTENLEKRQIPKEKDHRTAARSCHAAEPAVRMQQQDRSSG